MGGHDEVDSLRARVIELEAKLDEANRSIAKLLEMNERAVVAAEQATALSKQKIKEPVRRMHKKIDDMARQIEFLEADKNKVAKMLEAAMSLLTHVDQPFGKPILEIIGTLSAAAKSGEIDVRDIRTSSLLAHMRPELRAAFETAQTFTEAMARSSIAQEGAARKLANDPKQAAKAEAFKLWQQWQQGKTRHSSGAAFARNFVESHPAITSTKVVERWVTDWQRNAANK